MTTESTPRTPFVGRPILGAAVVTAGLGVAVALLGGLVDGSAALAGALLGTGLAVVVLTLGTLTVGLVAAVAPQASLLVALLTYVLQVLALALAFAVLTGSGALDAGLDRSWLGAAIVAATLTWSIAQIRLVTTARIPLYGAAR